MVKAEKDNAVAAKTEKKEKAVKATKINKVNAEKVERNLRKTRIGLVVSDKMDKTIVVEIQQKTKHPLYKKTVITTKRFKAHDENNDCHVGDTVSIIETRRLSKDKNWRVLEILEKAK